MAAIDIVRGYQATVEDTGRELETQARIISEEMGRNVQGVDVVLRHIAAEFKRGRLSQLTPAELARLSGPTSSRFRSDRRNSNARCKRATPSRFRGRPSGLRPISRISQDLLSCATTRRPASSSVPRRAVRRTSWAYPLLRRLETPSGEFAGVIGARGRIDYLQQFYHDVHLDPGTKITLMHRNATLLARDPPIDAALGSISRCSTRCSRSGRRGSR